MDTIFSLVSLVLSLVYFIFQILKFSSLQIVTRNKFYYYVQIVSNHICLNRLLFVFTCIIINSFIVTKLLIVSEFINEFIQENLILKLNIREEFSNFDFFLLLSLRNGFPFFIDLNHQFINFSICLFLS